MTEPVGLDERLRLRRWLAAVGLTSAAEDAARVDTPETNAMALLGAHAACEALLGLLAGVRRHKPGDDVAFGRLLDSAAAKATIEPGLSDDLDAMHRIRNDFVHASTSVAGDEAARAISNARRLMDLVPASLAALWSLPANAGVGTAVAEIIGVEVVGMWLRHAEVMQEQRRWQLAADGLARALDTAIDRAEPALRNERAGQLVRYSRPAHELGLRGLDRVAEATQQQIDELRLWVLPIALGVPVGSYHHLRDIIGRELPEDVGGHPRRVLRPGDVPVDEDNVRRAMSQTAEIIFRLWAIGSLRPRDYDAKLVSLAAEFIADPSGYATGEIAEGL